MSPPILAPPDPENGPPQLIDNQRPPSDRDELRQNIAQLKLGEECLRRKRLLGGAGNQNYETYSLPVSRVPSNSPQLRGIKLTRLASID